MRLSIRVMLTAIIRLQNISRSDSNPRGTLKRGSEVKERENFPCIAQRLTAVHLIHLSSVSTSALLYNDQTQ